MDVEVKNQNQNLLLQEKLITLSKEDKKLARDIAEMSNRIEDDPAREEFDILNSILKEAAEMIKDKMIIDAISKLNSKNDIDETFKIEQARILHEGDEWDEFCRYKIEKIMSETNSDKETIPLDFNKWKEYKKIRESKNENIPVCNDIINDFSKEFEKIFEERNGDNNE